MGIILLENVSVQKHTAIALQVLKANFNNKYHVMLCNNRVQITIFSKTILYRQKFPLTFEYLAVKANSPFSQMCGAG